MSEKRGLGRGLSALIPSAPAAPVEDEAPPDAGACGWWRRWGAGWDRDGGY